MIAITGANGLLGSFILKKFLTENLPVVGLKRVNSNMSLVDDTPKDTAWREADVLDHPSLLAALSDVHTVIHAAGIVSFNPRAKKKIVETNVTGTKNIVNACLALNIKHLIFISSVAAFGQKQRVDEIDETTKWINDFSNVDYAKSKYLAELEVFRGQEEGLNISIINPSTILAPANAKKSSAQIFDYVLRERKFYADIHINYVDARDVVELIYTVYKTKPFGEKIIVNAGKIKIKDLTDKIADRLRKKKSSLKIGTSAMMPVAWLEEIRSRIFNTETLISRQAIKLALNDLTYRNEKSITEMNLTYHSLDETLDWCCAYYKKLLP